MKKEKLITLVEIMEEHGNYDVIRKEYSTQNQQKEQYLQIFDLLFKESFNYDKVLDELSLRKNLFLSKSQLYRLIDSVALSLVKLDLIHFMNASPRCVIPSVLYGCNSNLSHKASILYYILLSIEEEYLGHITCIPSEIIQPILQTRDGARINAIIKELKELNISPSISVFESISYSNGKINFKFTPIISTTIIFFTCIAKASA